MELRNYYPKRSSGIIPTVPKIMILYTAESIQWFIEDQAFVKFYDSAPHPPHPNPAPVSNLSLFLSLPVCRRWAYWQERGEGSVRGATNLNYKYSILSGAQEDPRLHNRDIIHLTPIFCPTACFDPRSDSSSPTSPVIPRAFHVILSQLLASRQRRRL